MSAQDWLSDASTFESQYTFDRAAFELSPNVLLIVQLQLSSVSGVQIDNESVLGI